MAVILSAEHLNKSFGGVDALVDVSVEFSAGSVIALIGPNGAGKTTLLNVLTGFARADSGQIAFRGKTISSWSAARIAEAGIRRTFQQVRLIRQLSALENVMLALPAATAESFWGALLRLRKGQDSEYRTTAYFLLEELNLHKQASQLAGELSYGQQKLLTVACCLAGDAQVLLLDEPVAGVFPSMAQEILNLLKRLATSGRCVVFVEHDLAAVQSAADHVIVMSQGRCIREGSPREVLEERIVLEAYLGS